MNYRRTNTRRRKNSGWPATISEFVPGETYMHTGQYEIEPVQFVRYTRYGAGSSWGDPSRVEVRDRSGRLWETTVTRLRLPREGEVRNPSAVYGAFKVNPLTFSQKSELFRKQLAAFKRSSHIPARRRATARAIQDFLRREPFFEQTLPYDLLGVIRSAARESEVSRGRHTPPTAHMGDRVEFYAPGNLLKTGKVVGVYNDEYTVQIGDYGYAVKPHDIKRVYPR